VNVYIILIHDS